MFSNAPKWFTASILTIGIVDGDKIENPKQYHAIIS